MINYFLEWLCEAVFVAITKIKHWQFTIINFSSIERSRLSLGLKIGRVQVLYLLQIRLSFHILRSLYISYVIRKLVQMCKIWYLQVRVVKMRFILAMYLKRMKWRIKEIFMEHAKTRIHKENANLHKRFYSKFNGVQ